jgi:hypothetical protein
MCHVCYFLLLSLWRSNIPATTQLQVVLKQRKSTLTEWLPFDDDVTISEVSSGTANDGALDWTLPTSLSAGQRYHFQLLWTANGLQASSGLCTVLGNHHHHHHHHHCRRRNYRC